jgi:quercetin dioxygenase-like cupin family protein
MRAIATLILASSLAVACACGGNTKSDDKTIPDPVDPVDPAAAGIKLTPADQVAFTPLDPKAGDKGPMASVLFGAMGQKEPIGLLLKVPPGGTPGAHTHSSDDYAVGIRGTMHNFLADSELGTGIGAGGTWFQPANVPHDNKCTDDAECLIFLYLPNGFDFAPYQPAAGGMAVPGEIRVLAAADVQFNPVDPAAGDKGPQISVLFGNPQEKAPVGFLLKLPAGFSPGPHTHSSDDWAVVVQGTVHNFTPGDKGVGVTPGGTWFQPGNVVHDNHCAEGSDCLLFVYMPNGFDFTPAAK